jgi:putative glycosyltransferase (TIGR04372 family)
MSWLAQKGYYAFRMGHIHKEELQIKNKKIIDYAKFYRTEFMDVYLSTTCRMFVSCGTGLDAFAIIMGIPLVFVNYPHNTLIFDGLNADFIFLLPRKVYSDKDKKFLSLRELHSFKFSHSIFKPSIKKRFDNSGHTFINSTPTEILQVAQEVDARLRGTWVETEQDRELQERYRYIVRTTDNLPYDRIKKLPPDYEIKYHLSAHFLRENADWYLK